MTRRLALLLWLGLTEGAIWVLAALGPGYRHGTMQEDRGLIARFFIENPSFWQDLLINALYLNVFVGVAVFAAWRAKRRKASKAARSEPPPAGP